MSIPSAGPHARLAPLDGLRTIAVALVILFHVKAPAFAAGYIGVDIFFVLSGYLITAGLIREWGSSHEVDLGRFWARRVRRLLPASLVMVAAVLIWAVVATSRYQQAGVGADAFWTMLYVANWHFIGTSSYFSSDGTTSPLEHMWSLAVEEQFYVFWPLLFAGVGWLVARRARRGRHTAPGGRTAPSSRMLLLLALVGGTIAVVSVSLLGWLYDPEGPERAYMGTDSKAFEPMLGALLAVTMAHRRGKALALRHAELLVAAGVVSMLALFLVLDGPAPLYFQGGALLFSVAAATVIAGAAMSTNRVVAGVLGNRPMAYLGQISYALYLWHWPWAIWLGAHEAFVPTRAAAVIALTVACSIASYHLVELPVRQGRLTPWLTTRRTLLAAASSVAIVMLPAVLVGQTPVSGTVQAAAGTVSPDLVPGAEADTTIVLVGDSVPRRLMPALAPAAERRGVTLVSSASAGGCSPLAVHQRISSDDAEGSSCPVLEETQLAAVEAHDPDTVLWWSRYEIADRVLADDRLLRATDSRFWTAQQHRFEQAVDRLTAGGATLVVVETERPGVGLLTRCSEEDCHPFLRRMVMEDELRRQWNALVAETAATDPRVRVVRIEEAFCPTPAPTPIPSEFGAVLCDDSVALDRPARPDGSHFDVELVGEDVSEALLEAIEGRPAPSSSP